MEERESKDVENDSVIVTPIGEKLYCSSSIIEQLSLLCCGQLVRPGHDNAALEATGGC